MLKQNGTRHTGQNAAEHGSRRGLKPFKQGGLDELCGLYAVINAVRLAIGTLSHTHSKALVARLFEVSDELSRLAVMASEGTGARDVMRLAYLAKDWVAEQRGIHIHVHQHLRGGRRKSFARVAVEMREFLTRPRTSIVLGLAGYHDHWSVAVAITDSRLVLFDSTRLSGVALAHCRMAHERKRKAGIEHVIGRGSVLFFDAG